MLQKFMGRRIPDAVWTALVDKRYVADYFVLGRDKTALAVLAGEAKRLVGSPSRRRRASTSKTESAGLLRSRTLGRLATAAATRELDVRAFRREVLGDQLVPFNEVRRWIARHAGPRRQIEFEVFALPSRDDPSYFRILKVGGSPALEWLATLSNRLSTAYGWEPWEALYVVLTDAEPLRWPLTVSYTTPPAAPGMSRVLLSVDPATPPEEVAKAYAYARKVLVGTRHRNINEKNMLLAWFVAGRPEDEPLATQMAVWNRINPRWRYTAVTNFGRDRIHARRRLMDPNYERDPDPRRRARAESVLEQFD